MHESRKSFLGEMLECRNGTDAAGMHRPTVETHSQIPVHRVELVSPVSNRPRRDAELTADVLVGCLLRPLAKCLIRGGVESRQEVAAHHSEYVLSFHRALHDRRLCHADADLATVEKRIP